MARNLSLKTPPHDPEAECAALCCALLDGDGLESVVEILGRGDAAFHDRAHQAVYDAVYSLHKEGQPADAVSVVSWLREHGKLDVAGGASSVAELTGAAPTSANAGYYATTVRNRWLLRETLALATRAAGDAYQPDADPREVLGILEREALALLERGARNGAVIVETLIDETVNSFQVMLDAGGLSGLPLGFADIDRLTAGLKPGQVCIVAGRPGTGKTALALNAALHVADTLRKPVAFFSLEMSRQELMIRMLYTLSGITLRDIENGRITPANAGERLRPALAAWKRMPLLIDDTPALDTTEIRSELRRLVRRQGVALAIIDYLQLVRPSARSDSRASEVAEISGALKAAAKECGIPVLALCQLNRQADGERPRLSHLRESGAIEQDADLVLLLCPDEKRPNVVEANIAKNRNGRVGKALLLFDKDRQLFKPFECREHAYTYVDVGDPEDDVPF
ncbi:MAG: replicative DNA helicase [Candidatus Hydrogenedentes bacterium]|nr:replicative DNA helicase [Candidatus Hydrogenedentota bacterium]